MTPTPWTRLLLPALLVAAPLCAQDSDLAERLLRSGERAYLTKAFGEAMDTWEQLLKQAPASPQAGEALLRMAQHLAEVEGKPQAALPLLDRLRADHMKTPAAPEGLLLRGKVLVQLAKKPQDLKDAIAEFNRLVDLFPSHGVVPRARLALGDACMAQGQAGRALEHLMEVLRWDPAAPEAATARFQVAEILDRMGDLQGCLRMLQACKDSAPGTPLAEEAAWRIAQRVHHRILKPALVSKGLWPEGKKDWLKTPTLMAMGPQGDLYIYQEDLDQAFRLEGTGLKAAAAPVKGAKGLFLTSQGKVALVSPKVGLVVEGLAAPIPLGALTSPSGLVVDRWGTCWVSDTKAGSIGLLSADGGARSLPSPSLVALAAMPGGGVVGASDANRSLIFLDHEGQPRLNLPYGKDLPAPFKYVVALASDPCGHVAALVDGDFEGVVVWGPQGQVLRQATYKALGISGRFRSLAFDRSGGLLLADRSHDLILRLQ